MTEENNDIITDNEEKAPKEVIIPEFYRDLNADPEQKGLWHYVFRTNGDRKPIKTEDGKPHKLDFNWKDMPERERAYRSRNRQRQGQLYDGLRRKAPRLLHHG